MEFDTSLFMIRRGTNIKSHCLIIYLSFNTKQTEVTRPPPGTITPPSALLPLSQVKMCVCSSNLSQGYKALFLLSSRILKSSIKYATKSESLSTDLTSLNETKKGTTKCGSGCQYCHTRCISTGFWRWFCHWLGSFSRLSCYYGS